MNKLRSPWLFLFAAAAVFLVALPARRAPRPAPPTAPGPAAQRGPFDEARGRTRWSTVGAARVARDELLLEVDDWLAVADLEAALQRAGGRVVGGLPGRRLLRVRLPGVVEDKALLRSVRAFPRVRRVEWNGAGEGGQLSPDDTFFSRQWHLRNTGQNGATAGADVGATEAWPIQTGDSGVVVAVLDTGLDGGHPEFAGRTVPGWDFVDEDPDPQADHPHGVQVAALLGANTDNFFGVAGVDRACRIAPLKVLDDQNRGTTFDLVQALDWCATNRVDVVSLSLVNYPSSAILRDALAAARAAGCILIACAGNGGVGDADVSWPGASPDTLSIGFTDRFDRRHPSSGTGAALDFVAPGAGLYTASDSYINTYSLMTGCSAATPIAAGIVALLLAEVPDLTQADVQTLLQQGAADQVGLPGEDLPGRDDYHGYGRLSALRSLTTLCSCDGSEDLRASPAEVSVVRGGRQLLRLSAGATQAGRLYWVFGSLSGTSPGIPLHGLVLPLNWDGYLAQCLASPNVLPLVASLGHLDADGRARAELQVPAQTYASLTGLDLHHAFLVLAGARVVYTSRAVVTRLR